MRGLLLFVVLGCETAPLAVGDEMTGADGGLIKPEYDAAPHQDGSTPGQDAEPGELGPRCEPETEESSALFFDGVNDHVTMGVAPTLGLGELTLEAWIRRDGPGLTMGTGVGGLSMVPIAGKGRGESDGSNLDCNYAFGIWGDVLGADFEDAASGANHPVYGRTAISMGEWHHVAVTYDGTTWKLYLDGRLDGQANANASPRADSIHHFGIGTAFNSQGAPAGRFQGAIDEVRVWDRARTEEEIAGARYSSYQTLSDTAGMVSRWGFDASDGETALDRNSVNPGTIVGAVYSVPGVVLDRGTPASVTALAPLDEALTATSVSLSVRVEDDSDGFEVRFYGRPITDADDFTIVVLPDTQYYTEEGDGLEQFYYDQTQWIVDNAEAYNIRAVIHNGDIVNRANQNYQWTVADRAHQILEEPFGEYQDGVPYGLAVGNHDESPNGDPAGTTAYNRWFGVPRFQGRAYYGGHYGTTNDENWITFSAGGLDFVVVSLKYNVNPPAAVLNWAKQVFAMHPDSFGILNSHYILNGSGNFGPQGQRVYDTLRGVQNLHLMTCGHISAERRRTDTYQGHAITSMLADYQSRAQGGGGSLRIWEFSPANDELTVRTYSPSSDTWETDENSEFTVRVDLSGAGSEFEILGTVEARGSQTATVTLPLPVLRSNTRYEWFALVDDCDHLSLSQIPSFSTLP